MRRLIGIIFRLCLFAVIASLGLAGWVVWDGISDRGDHADCAVVPGSKVYEGGLVGDVLKARLDTAAELFRAGRFPLIIVSGANHMHGGEATDGNHASSGRSTVDEASSMAKYLQAQGVPPRSILADSGGINTDNTARDVAAIMKARHLKSIMVVTSYYHVTRTKWALQHAGVADVQQAHSGVVNKNDVYDIGREVVGIYDYLFTWYLKPAATKVQVETETVAEKAKVSVEKGVQQVEDKAKDDHR